MSEWLPYLQPGVTLAGFAAASIAVVVAMRRDVKYLSSRMTPLENAANSLVEKLAGLLATISRHDERIKAVERDLERNELRAQRRQTSPR